MSQYNQAQLRLFVSLGQPLPPDLQVWLRPHPPEKPQEPAR
jgi:hypothetical protein